MRFKGFSGPELIALEYAVAKGWEALSAGGNATTLAELFEEIEREFQGRGQLRQPPLPLREECAAV